MIEEIGTVVATEPGYAWIETQVKTTCGSCAANDNCGTGIVAKAFTPKSEHLRIATPSPLQIGQSVKIGIPEHHLLTASMWVYFIPICSLLLSAATLQYLTVLPEHVVIIVSFLFTLLTYWGISSRLKSARFRLRWMPIFLGATTEPMISRKHEIPLKKL